MPSPARGLRCPTPGLRQSFDKKRQPDGGHKQRNGRLIDQAAQHNPLNRHPHQHHDAQRNGGQSERHPHFFDADKGQGGKQHQRALGKVKRTGGLVNQDKAQGDQRIHHASEQAADQLLLLLVLRSVYIATKVNPFLR